MIQFVKQVSLKRKLSSWGVGASHTHSYIYIFLEIYIGPVRLGIKSHIRCEVFKYAKPCTEKYPHKSPPPYPSIPYFYSSPFSIRLIFKTYTLNNSLPPLIKILGAQVTAQPLIFLLSLSYFLCQPTSPTTPRHTSPLLDSSSSSWVLLL